MFEEEESAIINRGMYLARGQVPVFITRSSCPAEGRSS